MPKRTSFLAAVVFMSGALAVFADNNTPPPFVILEMGAGTSLKLDDVRNADVEIPLTIQSRHTVAATILLRITEFTDAKGRVIHPTLDDKNVREMALTLDKGAEQRVLVHAMLVAESVYRATVSLVHEGKPSTFTIEVKRVMSEPPVEIPELSAASISIRRLRTSKATFATTLYPVEGQKVSIEPPLLQAVTRKNKSDSPTGLRASGVELTKRDKPIEFSTAPVPITLELTNMGQPGRYDAIIRYRSSGFKTISRTLTVYAREEPWVPVVWILFGIVIALILRGYGVSIRPRLVLQRRVTALDEELERYRKEAAGDPASLRLIDRVARSMRAKWDELRTAGRLKGTTEFDIYNVRVPAVGQFVALRRKLRTLPEALRAAFEAKLEQPEKTIGDDTKTAEEVKTQTSAISDLWRDAARASALYEELVEADAQLAAGARPELAPVSAVVKQARAELEAGKLNEAEATLRKARKSHADAILTTLEQRVKGEKPVGVGDEEWETLKTLIGDAAARARAAIDPEIAIAAMNQTLGEYLRTLTIGLERVVELKLEHAADKEKWKPVAEKLEDVKADLRASRFMQSWTKLDEAQKEYADIVKASPAGGMMGADAVAFDALSAAAAPSSATEAFDIVDGIDKAPSASEVFVPGGLVRAERALGLADAGAALIILVVAAFTGLQVLWMDNLTWGGWQSYLAAFLWGFAFDQFTHSGVVALMKKT